MPVHIALLRGINVGGKNRIAMPALREMAIGLGYTEVATYIQSGNLIVTSPAASDEIAAELRRAIAATMGVAVPVATRTATEWSGVIAANPFPVGPDEGKQLHVVFLAEPAGDSYDGIAATPPEQYAVSGREVYLWLPNGIGRSKLAAAIAHHGEPGTVRNWNTVLELAEMAAG